MRTSPLSSLLSRAYHVQVHRKVLLALPRPSYHFLKSHQLPPKPNTEANTAWSYCNLLKLENRWRNFQLKVESNCGDFVCIFLLQRKPIRSFASWLKFCVDGRMISFTAYFFATESPFFSPNTQLNASIAGWHLVEYEYCPLLFTSLSKH